MARRKRLHSDATHRVTDQYCVTQIETDHDRRDVIAQVFDCVTFVAHRRVAVTALVDGDHAVPGRDKRVVLSSPCP